MQEKGGGLLDLIPTLIGQLRDKYQKERVEISHEVAQHLADMRRSQHHALDGQSQLRDMLSSLLDRLESMEVGSLDDNVDMHSYFERMTNVERGLRDAVEEQQLLKAALFHDRLMRNERHQRQSLANEQVALRMKQAEDTLDVLRTHLQQWRTVNSAVMDHAEVLYRFVDDNYLNGQDGLLKVQRQLLKDLSTMKEEQEILSAKVAKVKSHCDRVEADSSILYKRLEDTVDTIGSSRNMGNSNRTNPQESAAAVRIRHNLERFYKKYQPKKLNSIDAILQEYQGAEAELYAALEVQYNAFGYFSL